MLLFWVVTPGKLVGRYQHWYLPMSLYGITTQKNNIVTLMLIPSVSTYESTQRRNPEEKPCHPCHRYNLKSHKGYIFSYPFVSETGLPLHYQLHQTQLQLLV